MTFNEKANHLAIFHMIQRLIYLLYFMLVSSWIALLPLSKSAMYARLVFFFHSLFISFILPLRYFGLLSDFFFLWSLCTRAFIGNKNSVGNWKFMRNYDSFNFVSLAFVLSVNFFVFFRCVYSRIVLKSNKLTKHTGREFLRAPINSAEKNWLQQRAWSANAVA